MGSTITHPTNAPLASYPSEADGSASTINTAGRIEDTDSAQGQGHGYAKPRSPSLGLSPSF